MAAAPKVFNRNTEGLIIDEEQREKNFAERKQGRRRTWCPYRPTPLLGSEPPRFNEAESQRQRKRKKTKRELVGIYISNDVVWDLTTRRSFTYHTAQRGNPRIHKPIAMQNTIGNNISPSPQREGIFVTKIKPRGPSSLFRKNCGCIVLQNDRSYQLSLPSSTKY